MLFLLLLLTISIFFAYSFGKKEQTPEPSKQTLEAQTQQTSPITPAPKRSYAGTIDAPEFPDGMDWLNVKEPLKFSSLRGKIVLLDFWTYGCINCMHNIPFIKQLQEEYPNELVVIGIHSAKFANEGRVSSLRNIVLRYGITYPVVNDPEFVLWQMWGPRAWPTLVLVDPAGKVSAATMGEGFYPQFKEIIQSLKEEFSVKSQLDTRPWRNLLLQPEARGTALLNFPGKVRVDPSGTRLFIADSGNHRILQVDAGSGNILIRIGSGTPGFRDGTFDTAKFRNPQGMTVSPDGKVVYVADTGNHALRKIDLRAGNVTTLAGTGKQSEEYPPSAGLGPDLPLSSPWDVELAGNTLYIAMAGSHQIWRMDLLSRRLSPLAGSGAEGFADGIAQEAELAQPSGISLDPNGRLYCADSEGSSVRYIELKDLKVGTLAGAGNSLFDFGAVDAIGKEARFQHPLGVKYHNGKLYVADTYNHRIRVIDPRTAMVKTLTGADVGFKDGQDSRWDEPGGLDAWGNTLYVADTNNHAIRWVNLSDGSVATLTLKESSLSQGSAGSTSNRSATLPGPGFPGAEILFTQASPPLRFKTQEVSTGMGEVALFAELPKGYKLTAEAFSTFAVRSTGGAARYIGVSPLSLQAPSFPIRIPFEFLKGEGEVLIEASIAYCAEDGDSLCFIDRRRIEVPIRVTEKKGREIPIRYSLIPAR